MTTDRGIEYEALTQQALRGVVRAVLTRVARSGLPGEHHFYIAFDTGISRRITFAPPAGEIPGRK